MTAVRVLADDLGTAVAIPPEVRRVVSLVPSLTEAVARSRRDCSSGPRTGAATRPTSR